MKVGDELQQTVPFNFPMGDEQADMSIQMTYFLNKIENGIGYFDIVYKMAMKTTGTFMAEFYGRGAGTTIYDSNIDEFIALDAESPVYFSLKLEDDLFLSGEITNKNQMKMTFTPKVE